MTPDRQPSLESAVYWLETQRSEQAKQEALAYMSGTPRSAEGFLVLATALVQLGELDKALLALAQSLGLDATPSAYQLLGLVLQALGQPTYAERAFATVLQLDPDHPSAMAHRLAVRGQAPESPLDAQAAETVERLFTLATPTLSACLIVKDEAANLGRCLESLNGWVDEIVVVDTGSTDETVSIAASFGAKVAHFAWCDDFSAARNASLELATSDWVLVIDADEQLQVEDREALLRALRRREAGAYVVHQANVREGGELENLAPVMRLFQRHAAIRFSGRLHEVVGPALQALGWSHADLFSVRLMHEGYQPAAMAERAKGARNVAIAERAAAEQPDDPFTLLQLARSYCFNHQPAEALPVFERLRAMPETVALPLPLWANYVSALQEVYQAVGRFADAEALLDESLTRLPGFPDFHFERGLVRYRLGEPEAARADFECCLSAHGRDFGLAVRHGVTDTLPRQALAELRAQPEPQTPSLESAISALQLQQFEEAKARALDYMAIAPRSGEGFLVVATALLRLGQLDKALFAVGQALALNASASGYYLLGVVLSDLDQPSLAERAFVQALRLNPDHPHALAQRLACRGRHPGHVLVDADVQAIERLFTLASPTVSACLIVKDEAANLGRCLESLNGWVDEIVVVDTGSTDETVSIAASFGAKVAHFAWCDDFSAARNASLELATSDWVLVIDADEQLQVSDPETWQRALRLREPGGYVVNLRNLGADGTPDYDTPLLRLFQRLEGVRYAQRLHETLEPAFAACALTTRPLPGAQLLHTGYQPAAMAARGKGARNLAIAQTTAAAQPNDLQALLQLARAYCFDGQPLAALPVFERLRAMPETNALPQAAWVNYITLLHEVYQAAGRFADAENVLDEALTRVPGFPDFHYDRGRLYARTQRAEQAAADFRRCLEAEGRAFGVAMRHGVTGDLPRRALAALEAAQVERPTVSACLIVKDEAANLGRCLASLNGWVDEIVVVDTGSTDETVSIAESFGAKVAHFAWCDDFSAARNASLELATSDWVLVIDADEQLQIQDPAHWHQVLTGPVEAVVLTQANVAADGHVETETPALRLFKRRAGLRFAGRLHESIAEAARASGATLGEAPFLRLLHTGYQPSEVAAGDKGARNTRLARLAVEEAPDSALAWLDLARSHAYNEAPEQALAAFERLMALPGGLDALADRPWSYAVQALQATYLALGRPDDAERVLDAALVRMPDFPELRFARAELRRDRGDRAGAAGDYRACLSAHGRTFPLSVRPGLTDDLPRRALAALETAQVERPTVSACLIVKDEAANLGRCLESLNGWVDEIVVVDTGSTDETVSIAESFGAKVAHFAWCDDFSAARNASLELATSDWVLVIDADEQLQIQAPAHWHQVLTAEGLAYHLEVVNVETSGQIASRVATFTRLFRRHSAVRFAGRMHESPQAGLDALGVHMQPLAGAWIRHEGYSDQAIAQGDKIARNRHLAERMLADDPHDPEAWHFLANTCWLAKDAPATLDALAQVRRLEAEGRALSDNLRRTATLVAAWALQAAGRLDEAHAELNAGLARLPGFPEYHFERGRVRAALGDARGASVDFEACLAAPRGAWAAREGLSGYLAHAELAELHVQAGRLAQAAEHLRAAGADPACPPGEAAHMSALAERLAPAAPIDLEPAMAAIERGNWPRAKQAAIDYLSATPRSAEGFLVLATALVQLGELDKALLALAQSLGLDATPSAYQLLGLVLQALGQPTYAERAFATVLQLDPDHPSAMAHRLAVRGQAPESPLAPQAAETVERLFTLASPTVSACLIVKDEAANLGRCLESLNGWVDEIVVVDTGSTDETVSIAESFGAKVAHFAWCDDFSAARNASLELATSDWVLVIDADEQLQVEDREALLRALRRREAGGYILDQRNLQENGELLANPMMRLFQRRAEIRFNGRLHEDVTRAIAALDWSISDVPQVSLLHDGYMREQIAAKDKWGRNFRLALADVEAQPEDVVAWYNLGRSAMFLGQADGANVAFAQVARRLALGDELSESRWCTYVSLHARLLEQAGRSGEAIALLEAGLTKVPDFPEFHYERGRMRMRLGDMDGARADFQACQRPLARRYLAALRDGIRDTLPRQALAELDAAIPRR